MPEAHREFQQKQHSLRKMDYATLYMPCGLRLRICALQTIWLLDDLHKYLLFW